MCQQQYIIHTLYIFISFLYNKFIICRIKLRQKYFIYIKKFCYFNFCISIATFEIRMGLDNFLSPHNPPLFHGHKWTKSVIARCVNFLTVERSVITIKDNLKDLKHVLMQCLLWILGRYYYINAILFE